MWGACSKRGREGLLWGFAAGRVCSAGEERATHAPRTGGYTRGTLDEWRRARQPWSGPRAVGARNGGGRDCWRFFCSWFAQFAHDLRVHRVTHRTTPSSRSSLTAHGLRRRSPAAGAAARCVACAACPLAEWAPRSPPPAHYHPTPRQPHPHRPAARHHHPGALTSPESAPQTGKQPNHPCHQPCRGHARFHP